MSSAERCICMKRDETNENNAGKIASSFSLLSLSHCPRCRFTPVATAAVAFAVIIAIIQCFLCMHFVSSAQLLQLLFVDPDWCKSSKERQFFCSTLSRYVSFDFICFQFFHCNGIIVSGRSHCTSETGSTWIMPRSHLWARKFKFNFSVFFSASNARNADNDIVHTRKFLWIE